MLGIKFRGHAKELKKQNNNWLYMNGLYNQKKIALKNYTSSIPS